MRGHHPRERIHDHSVMRGFGRQLAAQAGTIMADGNGHAALELTPAMAAVYAEFAEIWLHRARGHVPTSKLRIQEPMDEFVSAFDAVRGLIVFSCLNGHDM